MDDAVTSVLLVGSCARKSSSLGRHLSKRGCNLSLAANKKEAIELLQRRRFDVVLSGFRLPDGTAYELMAPLRGTDTTMFFSFAVEDSCWWITALLQGQDRSEQAGMRPREFTMVLDEQLSKKSSKSNAHNASGSPKAGYTSGSTNRQAATDVYTRESKKKQCHDATNQS
jgi:DNA-binding NtrC family response regulator